MEQKVRRTFKNKAFTLIELLVVISIIALLLSILMPALTKVKAMAMNIVDQATLRSWGTNFHLYCAENDGKMMSGFPGGVSGDLIQKVENDRWIYALEPYYDGADEKFFYCPTTGPGKTGPYRIWKTPKNPTIGLKEGYTGSYGINGWTYNPADYVTNSDGMVAGRFPQENYWRKLENIPFANEVPLLMDSLIWNGYPFPEQSPPDFNGQHPSSNDSNTGMACFCVNRHNGFINSTFADTSCRKVGLKELWVLKWHRNYEIDYLPLWPDWMDGFKEYPLK